MAALFTTMWAAPNSSRTRAASASVLSRSLMSTVTPNAVCPSADNRLAQEAAASASMSATTTLAPCEAKAVAYAAPMPRPAPVTTATRPVRSSSGSANDSAAPDELELADDVGLVLEAAVEESADLVVERAVRRHRRVDSPGQSLARQRVPRSDVGQQQRPVGRGAQLIERRTDRRRRPGLRSHPRDHPRDAVDLDQHPRDLVLGPHGEGGEDVVDHLQAALGLGVGDLRSDGRRQLPSHLVDQL